MTIFSFFLATVTTDKNLTYTSLDRILAQLFGAVIVIKSWETYSYMLRNSLFSLFLLYLVALLQQTKDELMRSRFVCLLPRIFLSTVATGQKMNARVTERIVFFHHGFGASVTTGKCELTSHTIVHLQRREIITVRGLSYVSRLPKY